MREHHSPWTPSMPQTQLVRSRQHRMLAGVCGGMADWLGWDPTVVRILFVLVSIFSAAFPGMLVYVILWAIMPEADR
jgi:phage shock protein C